MAKSCESKEKWKYLTSRFSETTTAKGKLPSEKIFQLLELQKAVLKKELKEFNYINCCYSKWIIQDPTWLALLLTHTKKQPSIKARYSDPDPHFRYDQ